MQAPVQGVTTTGSLSWGSAQYRSWSWHTWGGDINDMTEVMIFTYLRLEMILYVCCGSVHQPLPCQEWEQHMHQSHLELIMEIDHDRI